MIFQPVLNVFLLLLFVLPVAAIAVLALVKGPSTAGSGTQKTHRALWALRLVMLLACFVMLLRPGIPGGATQTLATDTDIVLVVDTTASIVAEDWDGDKPRLDGVRADIQAIVEEYPGARFALITFDASADLRLPLTTDTTALISSLEVLRPEVTSQSRGSSIGIANRMLQNTLSAAAESSPERSRMVFYFGDGEQTVTSPPESFKGSEKYTDAGAVLGYGTAEGGPMQLTTGSLDGPSTGSGTQHKEYIEYLGEDALSVIDEKNLETLAGQLGVEYQHRKADAAPTLPEAPSTTTSYAESGTVGNVTELYWIAAVIVVALLGFELARAAMLVARLRQLRAPDRVAAPHTRNGVAEPVEAPHTRNRVAGPVEARHTRNRVAEPVEAPHTTGPSTSSGTRTSSGTQFSDGGAS
ncbi:VWA domain-containing protein [Microbacterium sp. SD291]|uniref:vWA domain-containing protein n=1 Tax=Microbacterium sp. SD291 TaxID=2782007 RepID=UPI001A97AC17|nr:VWA domain-containing protein [Microbacterium sp. SD291]MBO0980379.1 VWA domain-containing protein [Microbacterium sp. SD291]